MRLVGILFVLAAGGASYAWADKKLDEAVAKAEAQLAKGKEAEAVKILEKAAAQAPRDPEPPLALAQMMLKLGKLDEAAAALARAGERAPAARPPVRAHVEAVRSAFALRTGTVREALTLAQRAVEAESNGEALAALARAQARFGDPAARTTAERAVKAAPASGAAQLALGDALLAAHLSREAEAAYARAREKDPRSVAAASGLARAMAAQGKATPALEAAHAAVQLDAQSAEALTALGLAELAKDRQDTNGEAVAAIQQASFLDPKSAPAKLAVGRLFVSRGQLEVAAPACEEAARLDPTWPAPRVVALDVQLRRGDADGALAGLRALPDEMKATGEAQLLLGQLLLRKDDPDGAKAALDKAVGALPGLAEAQTAQAEAAYAAGELALAADAYGRAVAIDPDNLAYRSSHARFLAYDGRLEEAATVLVDLTGRGQGKDPAAFIQLGDVYRSFKPPRVPQAVAAYEQALKLDPKSGPAALGVARTYRAAGQWARAVTAYERVSTMGPKLEREALLGTAWCYYYSGDTYKANFFTGLAVRAGADVRAMRNALTSATPKTDDDVPELLDQLRSKHDGEQVRAVRELMGLGRPAVPYLASALPQRTTCLAAREAIVDGLGRLGPAARDALPSLDRLIKAGPQAGADAAREARLVDSMQAAAGKIRGKP